MSHFPTVSWKTPTACKTTVGKHYFFFCLKHTFTKQRRDKHLSLPCASTHVLWLVAFKCWLTYVWPTSHENRGSECKPNKPLSWSKLCAVWCFGRWKGCEGMRMIHSTWAEWECIGPGAWIWLAIKPWW